jgi:putative endonuclease
MGRQSKQIGQFGEDIAANYLRGLGYVIFERNFRSTQGEVDIIAEDGEVLVFVEVKNYSFRSLGSPYAAVNKNKRENIIHAARTYLYKRKITDKTCRFDVLTICWDESGGRKIELIKDAFRLG